MSIRSRPIALFAVSALLLAGCNQARDVAPNEYFNSAREQTGNTNAPGILGDAGISFGIGGKQAGQEQAATSGIGVNAYLWRATLDTLSFMPLVSADPMGGVIITDWWQTGTAPRERFKATAYILSRRLRSDGIKVSIFRQVDQSGQWVDTPVSATTRGEIEDKIIARARELRAPFAQN